MDALNVPEPGRERYAQLPAWGVMATTFVSIFRFITAKEREDPHE